MFIARVYSIHLNFSFRAAGRSCPPIVRVALSKARARKHGMPPQMKMTAQYSSPRGGGGIEAGNKLGSRPVVRQSKIYRQNESGNAMKALMGHDDLSWDTEKQQGVFSGQAVYDAEHHHSPPGPSGAGLLAGSQPLASQEAYADEVEYPLPGCDATCDGCGLIVQRFYHCADCADTDLFDLCTTCCASVYLKQGNYIQLPPHPTHVFASHRMVQIAPQD